MAAVIDLCTPPSSPRCAPCAAGPSAPVADGARMEIDLITPPGSPLPGAAEPVATGGAAGPSGASGSAAADKERAPLASLLNASGPSEKALGKRAADPTDTVPEGKRAAGSSKPEVPTADSDDDECMEVEQQQAAPAPQPSADRRGDEDDEIEFTGRTGSIALSDFPHARENCVERPWKLGTEVNACPNCYCYVCDDVAKSCPKWAEHCKATHTNAQWRLAREQWKHHAQNPAPAAAGSSSTGLPFGRPGNPNPAAGETRWSMQQLIKGIEQVYPEERAEPAGFAAGYTLRPYQRQSLAFMINIEESTDRTLVSRQEGTGQKGRMSLGRPVRGGWLADEMGMGKTVVCAALILATRHKGKTVVLVNNSLVGQWFDELKKFAPGLSICKKYGSATGNHRTADVVITTPHSNVPDGPNVGEGYECHRLIVDESHLCEKGADPKMPHTKILENDSGNYYKASRIWLVTGTPFSNSLKQIEMQARMLGHWDRGLLLSNMDFQFRMQPSAFNTIHGNQWFADQLKKVMIRHSKGQRINGEAALSLPDADAATVWLTMSADERLLYDLSSCADGVPKWGDVNRVTDATLADLSSGLSKRRAALATDYGHDVMSLGARGVDAKRRLASAVVTGKTRWERLTKFRALKEDLEALRAAEPGVSVVIFTHHNGVMAQVASMLRDENMTVFEVSRATEPNRRHAALRQFQGGGGGAGGQARAFCTTFSAAAVGLTLTAASRVYLLEASLDPAQEAQAAGRIHRLGQTKEVLVKRFYFKDSLDEAIDELHQKIRTGDLALEGGRFPRAALQVFRDAGVTDPHKRDTKAPMTEAQRRYRSTSKRNVERYGGDGGFDYGKSVKTQPCLQCGAAVEVPGTSVWWGKGNLKSLDGKCDDHPHEVADMSQEAR